MDTNTAFFSVAWRRCQRFSLLQRTQISRKMSENCNTLEVSLMNRDCLEENQELAVKIKGKDERTCKAIRNIRGLEISIRELEQQLKVIRAESLDLQLKNCEELKNKLSTKPPETGSLAKNTRRFLGLCAAEKNNEKLFDKSYAMYEKYARSLKLQEKNERQESMIMTDEEKRRLDFLTSDPSDSTNETNFVRDDSIVDLQTASNPYSIEESSKKLLKELEDKLERNISNESNIA